VAFADMPQRRTAILVEAHSEPQCYGLDCPPWSVPDRMDFCFEAGGKFYTGSYHPSPFPWATKGKKLLALQGKTVTIEVTEKRITVTIPGFKLRLKRLHKDPFLRLDSCFQN
jgi:hypothetical protein